MPPTPPKRLAYLGTPAMAVPPLLALHDSGYDIVMVVSQPDRRRGRGSGTSPSPVKAAALERGIPVSDDVDALLDAGVDLGVVVAFGQIIKPHVLQVVPMVNLHFSMLPRWRGAAPVERAILAGDTHTGVAVMAVEEGLDTGGIFAEVEVPIEPTTTAEQLRHDLVRVGTGLLLEALATGLTAPRPQVGDPVYAAKLQPGDVWLDFALPAEQLARRVRVGGAHTTFRGRRLKVWAAVVVPFSAEVEALAPGVLSGMDVGCADGARLTLIEVQPEGRPRQTAESWRNGYQPLAGERLGD